MIHNAIHRVFTTPVLITGHGPRGTRRTEHAGDTIERLFKAGCVSYWPLFDWPSLILVRTSFLYLLTFLNFVQIRSSQSFTRSTYVNFLTQLINNQQRNFAETSYAADPWPFWGESRHLPPVEFEEVRFLNVFFKLFYILLILVSLPVVHSKVRTSHLLYNRSRRQGNKEHQTVQVRARIARFPA